VCVIVVLLRTAKVAGSLAVQYVGTLTSKRPCARTVGAFAGQAMARATRKGSPSDNNSNNNNNNNNQHNNNSNSNSISSSSSTSDSSSNSK